MRTRLAGGLGVAWTLVLAIEANDGRLANDERSRPNIVFIVVDDCSWASFGAYGDALAKTPAFDRLSEEGVLFTRAFVSEPTCGPSRASILTGQDFWRLEEASVFGGTLKRSFPVYPHLLAEAGYFVGSHGKVWSPGSIEEGGWDVKPGGKPFRSFKDFLQAVPQGRPFCFWLGSRYGHRPYTLRKSPDRSYKSSREISVPPFLPDRPEVRQDLIRHAYEVEWFDKDVGRMLALLDAKELVEDTIVVVTSDHGMAIPRGKANLYDWGVRVPLVIRWPARVAGGRVVEDFVSLTDLAPTFLEVAGLEPEPAMTGRSLFDLLVPGEAGARAPRDQAVFGREIGIGALYADNRTRGKPCRGIRTERFLYIRNYPIDGPPMDVGEHRIGPAGPILEAERGRDPALAPLYELCFGPRPAEELYDCASDPHQMRNLANEPRYADDKQELEERLVGYLVRNGDPRALGHGEVFANYRVFYQSSFLERNSEGDIVPVGGGAGSTDD